MRVKAYVSSITGRREENEDSYLVDAENGIFIVADGMGGHEGGAIASKLTVDHIHAQLSETSTTELGEDRPTLVPGDETMGEAEELVQIAIRFADRQVTRRQTGRLWSMGSTVVVAYLDDNEMVVGHVGDSRVYLLRDDEFVQLTRDHSVAEETDDEEIAEAMEHVLTRAVGSGDACVPDLLRVPLEKGDRFLLCTDGLTGVLDGEELGTLLYGLKPAEAPEALTKAAYELGSTDNITVAVLEVGGGK